MFHLTDIEIFLEGVTISVRNLQDSIDSINLQKKKKRKGSRLISHTVAHERTKPRREKWRVTLLQYSLTIYFLSLQFSFSLFLFFFIFLLVFTCILSSYFSLYPLRLIILFFHPMTEEHTIYTNSVDNRYVHTMDCLWMIRERRERD